MPLYCFLCNSSCTILDIYIVIYVDLTVLLITVYRTTDSNMLDFNKSLENYLMD